MTELLLGIDVGTSACKAAVVDARRGRARPRPGADAVEPVPTGAELDADALLGAVVDAAREALERAPEGDVAGIGVTSVAETGMLLDAAGAVLHRPSPGTTRAAPPRRRRWRATCPTSRSAPACPPARCARWPSSGTSAPRARRAG